MVARVVRQAVPEGRKAQRTRASLVAATRETIAATGAFSAEAAAARAGVAPATFYAYFASKDDALAAAFDEVLAELNARTAEALAVERLLDRGLAAVLGRAVRTVVDVFRTDALVFRLAVTRIPESAAVRRVYREREREGLAILRRFIRLAASAGRVRRDRPDVLANTMLVVLQGLNNPVVLRRRAGPEVVAEVAEMLEALLSPRRAPRAERPRPRGSRSGA